MTVLAPREPQGDPRPQAQALAAARSRIEVVGAVLAASGLAWWWTAERMAGMGAGPGTNLGALGWFIGVWVVMMAAMMLPPLAPMTATIAAVARRQDPRPWLGFLAGYMLIWAAAGIVAYGVFELGRVSSRTSSRGSAAGAGWRRQLSWRPRSTSSRRSNTGTCSDAGPTSAHTSGPGGGARGR
jgi:Predicted metal-binding integral membrane protein (DUF2182)